jgi:membrane protein implicated in regulation of membrane protease activity
MVAIGVQVYLAIRQSSELLTGIALVLIIVTALISDSLHITLSFITATAAAALYFLYRFNWWRLLVVTLILVYLSHILWLINNPLMGHTFEIVPSHPYNLVYLFASGVIFSMSTLIRRNTEFGIKGTNTIVLLNAFWFALTILLVTADYYPTSYVGMFGAISGFCLLFSVWLHLKTRSPFVPAFFACFGFTALSVSFYGYAKLPDAYFFLALQSFLVVSMALWFRSKIIVVVNSLLYLGILLIYLLSAHPVDRISFCFAFVAFATARILNLKKERLTLKTDLMRNMYLVALFFTLLFAFYHAVPGRYITLSWTAVAAGYFLLSFLLRNVKYRWMAIATLLVTVVYLFLVDLANLSIGYRVMAFLFLAVISISASLYYSNRVKKKRILKSEENVAGQSRV